MGQYWQLINLDKRQTYGSWGKMAESFFTGLPKLCLDQGLKIAPKLPDCDSLVFPYKSGALCQDFSESRRGRATYFRQTAAQSSALLNFPVETIQEIHSHLGALADLMCLSMTCQILWAIGREEIYCRVAIVAGNFSWAGDRIICVGDYLYNEDIPRGLLSPEETEEFTRVDKENGEPYTLFAYRFDKISHRRGSFNMYDLLMHSTMLGSQHRRFSSYVGLAPHLFDMAYETPESKEPAVLRNISRHEYVPESALILWKEGVEIEEMKGIGFGDIVFSRICLSSDPSGSMMNNHLGVWAGDRFDIVASDWLEGLDDDATWMDVSGEVLKEVEGIWYRYF
ncbi:hypothetical protein K438DRAFT_1783757 [Mycena galopus ATCC 62051]|nr:hypothetical protein K438DRAFT_1783757 [Mycena galopus ATCC 62051]